MVISFEQPEFDLGSEGSLQAKKHTREDVLKPKPERSNESPASAEKPSIIRHIDPSSLAPQPNPEAWDREEDPGDVGVMYRQGRKHR